MNQRPEHSGSTLLGVNVTKHISDTSARDLNDYHDNGVYETTNWANLPEGPVYTVTHVINYNGMECVQNCYNILNGECYRRIFVNNSWGLWTKEANRTQI